jgi:hypothetical protein
MTHFGRKVLKPGVVLRVEIGGFEPGKHLFDSLGHIGQHAFIRDLGLELARDVDEGLGVESAKLGSLVGGEKN